MTDVEGYLPHPGDGDMAGFYERMDAVSDGGDWLLLVNQLQILDFSVWAGARDLLAPLYAATGVLPAEFADMDVIVRRAAREDPVRRAP